MIVSGFILILSSLLAYLIGSFPTSYILAKYFKGIDIREVGSKNAGATNVFRSVGKLPALITLIVDILKGVFVVTVLTNFFYSFDIDFDYNFYRAFLGLVVVCGHIWPVFLKFRGGKGVATTLGVGIVIAPLALLPSVVVWIIAFAISQYISVASISAMISFPIIAAILNTPVFTTLIGTVICIISIYKHKDNIRRLIKREEKKTNLFKSNGK